MYPAERPRRLRGWPCIRQLVRETKPSARDWVAPLFVVAGSGVQREIASLPGQFHWSADRLEAEAERLADRGIPAVLLFGVSERKDATASAADAADAPIVAALSRLRKRMGDRLGLIADVCLCGSTEDGHCGLPDGAGGLDNDRTVERIAEVARAYARAGAHCVAPSDMMDGRVARIRSALDADGFSSVPLLSYAAKYASAFYGPFREAARSAPRAGDRKTYQMDPANVREALREIRLDLSEGADCVMVKPAWPSLDVIRAAREAFDAPIAAYSVSGEYACVKAAARAGWIDEKAAAMEILTAIRRAGADFVCTYWAAEAAEWFR